MGAAPVAVPPRSAAAGDASRGYDLTANALASGPRGSTARVATAGAVPAGSASGNAVSANAGGTSNGQTGVWQSATTSNSHYADTDGNVYRNSGDQWQQQSAGGWNPATGDMSWADREAQSRANAAVAENSVSVSNASRFTGAANDGWSQRDAGNGGYSRTLGGDGGISAEYNNYRDAVLNNEFDMAMNGGWWGDAVVVGWGGRLGGD